MWLMAEYKEDWNKQRNGGGVSQEPSADCD
jgi:hypothetical protein